MSKQQIQVGVIVLGLLLIAGIMGKQFLGMRGMGEFLRTRAGDKMDSAQNPPARLELPPLPEIVVKKQRMGLSVPWGRNPFVVKSKTSGAGAPDATPLSGLIVSGVVTNGDQGMAIVNGEIVREGETFKGYDVTDIDNSGVQLEKDGEKVVIPYAQ